MNNNRTLTLCRKGGEKDLPYVRIQGIWFRNFGFSPGDKIIVTNPEPHTLVMTVYQKAGEIDKEGKS